MNTKTAGFKKKLIVTAVASYALMGMSSVALAQDNIEEIVVTGIKGSLQRAMDIKRDAQGVVDAISAEDIGKFPDTNLAESLQRISGVSIDRVNGEGSKVTVRGFGPDYNLVTLNGRQMPTSGIEDTTASSSRSFDFANLASEGISGVEVYKSGRASVTSGGIGATINILTARPLDNPGLKASVGVKGVMDSSTEEGSDITPEVSGIYSQTFADDTFGVALSGSYQERDSGSKVASTGAGWRTFPGWANQDWGSEDNTAQWGAIPDTGHVNRPGSGDIYSIPQQLKYDFNEVQRTRSNAQLALQYRPVESFTATLDYTYSQLEVSQQYSDLSAWFNFGASTGEWTDGPNASPLIYSEPITFNPDAPHAPGYGDLAMGVGNFSRVNENNSVGLNLSWDVNDRLTLQFDAHNSEAESRPDGAFGSHNTLGTAAFYRVSSTADFSNDFPILTVEYPEGVDQMNPADIRVSGSSFRNSYSKSEIDQYQLKGNFAFDGGSSIDFGVASTEVSNRSAFANVQRDTWGGVGGAGDIDSDFWTRSTVGSKFDLSGSNNPALHDETFVFDFADLRNIAETLYTEPSESTPPGDCGTWFCPSTDYANGTDRYTEEETFSTYLQFNYKTELADRPVNVIAGVRYEETDVTSTAASPAYDGVTWVANNELSLNRTEGQEYLRLTGSYDHWLPNIDVDIEVVDDVILRASFSETIARPSYADIQAGTSVNTQARISGGSASRGNPGLLPFESTNFDLSAEWYYDEGSYLSVGWFKKDVKNFIGNSMIQEALFDLPNPADGERYAAAVAAVGTDATLVRNWLRDNSTGVRVDGDGNIFVDGIAGSDNPLMFDVTIPVNQKEASIDGWEFAVQHIFGESGFGVIANYTKVDGDISFDDLSMEDQFALLGLSDSANLVAFYDKNGWQARVAYNWRDKFLNSTFHGTGASNPVYIEAYGQVDINVSYDINDSITIFAEGLNITEEHTRSHGRTSYQLMNMVELGARYNIGARYTF